MRIIEPHQLQRSQKPQKWRFFKRTFLFSAVGLILVASILSGWSYSLNLPKVSAEPITLYSQGSTVNLPWPNYGQSSIGAIGYGLLSATSGQKPFPTASVAKIMTAIAVLDAKPLQVNDQGPTITMTTADVAIYNSYVAENGSVVVVSAGEQLTERQALEAMLLPSANNIADSLAIWAFGGVNNYASYANSLAKQLGLDNTSITSASGFPPTTVSTASDLVKLGIIAMNNPVIAQIVGEKTAVVPVAGKIMNVNFLLGQDNIVGIKTGSTDQAGGCYLFAATRQVDNKPITVVGAIMGASNLAIAMKSSLILLNASYQNFNSRKLVSKGDRIADYNLPWGGHSVVTADRDVTVLAWKGSNINSQIKLEQVEPGTKAGDKVGSVQSSGVSAQLVLDSGITTPKWSWRFSRWL